MSGGVHPAQYHCSCNFISIVTANMKIYVLLFSLLASAISQSFPLWNQIVSCPLMCTCRLEHLTETAIYRFIQKDNNKESATSNSYVENNEVLSEENLDTLEILEEHGLSVIRSAVCILQSGMEPVQLLTDLPKNIESLTLIQGYASGNKTIKFSYLSEFSQLVSLELIGPNIFNQHLNSHLISEIDDSLPDLKYLNLQSILIKDSKKQLINFLKEVHEEDLTFEYTLKLDRSPHALTMVEKGSKDEIMPYEVYKQQKQNNGDTPLFIGFKNLLLLRITSCELNNVNWEMFDGLEKLEYLILEKNNLKFIPPFAFYGTPHLKTLSLAHNKLLDIQITDLAGLLQLEYLDLSFNNFTQLSELSLPPFPNLKLANFANNPINVIFPNTFEVMNTTNSLIIGSDDMPLTLITNSLMGLNLLEKIVINNLQLRLLKRDMFVGMPNLKELVITGNVTELEYDSFLEVKQIKKLVLSRCQIVNISMDTFMGLSQLQYLDLSFNKLDYLPPGVFDELISIKELYLNSNKFKKLPRDVFSKIHPKLIRLNDNPWYCSCEMSEWKPLIVNRIKQGVVKNCNFVKDKGISCPTKNHFTVKYVFDNKVAPKCAEPTHFANWNIFHAMRKIFKCPDYKPKIKIHSFNKNTIENTTQAVVVNEVSHLKNKYKKLKTIPTVNNLEENDEELNRLSPLDNVVKNEPMQVRDNIKKRRKLKKYFMELRATNYTATNKI